MSSAGGRAGRRLEDRTPSGHHLHSGADVIRHQNVGQSPDQARRAVGEQRHNEPNPVAPPPLNEGGPRPELRIVEEHSSRRPIPGRTPSTHWWRHASRDRTHRRARDWQRYVGLERCFSRRGPQGIPTPARVESRLYAMGSSSRGARCPFDRRTWRAAEALRYASSGLSHPTPACPQSPLRSMLDVYEIVYDRWDACGRYARGELRKRQSEHSTPAYVDSSG